MVGVVHWRRLSEWLLMLMLTMDDATGASVVYN